MHEWGASVLARGACVKVANCCDPFFAGTLTRVNSLEHVCEFIFTTDCAYPAIVGYSFIL
jgi:hypothetical protein